jgi:hypothetical protein
MTDTKDGALRELSDTSWFEVGRKNATAFACNEKWLFRRVETLEFVGRRSFRRRISVDFEIPDHLPDLGKRLADDRCLVPISVIQKWPPLMDFTLSDADGLPASLYLRTTTNKLDFGLLLGMADLTIELGEDQAEQESWQQQMKRAHRQGGPRPERLPEALREKLAAMINNPLPDQRIVADAVNSLSVALLDRLGEALRKDRIKGESTIASHLATTVDLAAQLGGNSILWVAARGSPGTDQIFKFSYLGPIGATQLEMDGGASNGNGGPGVRERITHRLRRIAISCSWRRRRVGAFLLHAGSHVRYHLDVRAPEGSITLVELGAVALPAAPASDQSQHFAILSYVDIARKYAAIEVPDEWVGPASGGFYIDYGEPKTLATTAAKGRDARDRLAKKGRERSAEIFDRRGHIYLGHKGAPSHRVQLQLKLAALRHGFIRGCAASAVVIAILMWAVYLTFPAAAEHIDATAVLLAVVPGVLGFVLARPSEQAIERYHITGVRTMGLLSGAMPILGALTLVLSDLGDKASPDLTVVKPIWLVLAIISTTIAVGLLGSLAGAAPSKEPSEGTYELE